MKLINYVLIALLLLALGVIGWLYLNPKIEKVYVQIKPKPEIVYIEKKDGGTIATIPQQEAETPAETLSVNYMKYVNDTLLPALNQGMKYKTEVQQLTRINAVLKDSLNRKNIVLNDVKNDAITWKTKYIEISANPTDSTLKYAYNAQLDVLNYAKRKSIFSGRENLIAITSPDKNLRINGVENFTKSIRNPRNLLELNINAQAIYLHQSIFPNANAEIIFNPDGFLRPFIGYGYLYDHNSGKMIRFGNGGFKINLMKF